MFRATESTIRLPFILAAAAAVLPYDGSAEGFRNPPAGAFSLARAGGRRAQIDTPEAAYHNPANIVDLARPEAEISPTFVYLKVEHNGAGQTAETTDPLKLLPNFFANVPILENKLAAGLALTTPFGLGNVWEKDSGRFANGNPATGGWRYTSPYFAEMITIDANPSLSWKVTDWVSVGAGVDVVWSQLKLKQSFPTFLLPLPGGPYPETIVRATGDGIGVGGNAGVTFTLTENQRLAFTYRSPFTVHYDGDVRFDSAPLPESDFSSRVKFPTIVGAGYGLKVTDTIRLETDFEWLEFSNFDQLPIDAGSNAFLNQTVAEHWKNTFTAGIAGDWRFHDNWVWRAGYQYYESPVPDETFSPTIPDSNQHAFTTGVAFNSGHHSAGLSYGYIWYLDRNIDNANYIYNGHYEMTVHLFSVQYTFTF